MAVKRVTLEDVNDRENNEVKVDTLKNNKELHNFELTNFSYSRKLEEALTFPHQQWSNIFTKKIISSLMSGLSFSFNKNSTST